MTNRSHLPWKTPNGTAMRPKSSRRSRSEFVRKTFRRQSYSKKLRGTLLASMNDSGRAMSPAALLPRTDRAKRHPRFGSLGCGSRILARLFAARRTAPLFQTPGDPRLGQVVGRHLHFHAVADGQAHPALAHLATDGGEHEVFVVEFDSEHRAREHGLNAALDFNVFFFHKWMERCPGLSMTRHPPE